MKLKTKYEINNCKRKIKAYQKEINLLYNKEEKQKEIINKLMLSSLESKYLYKCYKVKNSYGNGKNWFIYAKIMKVIKEDLFEAKTFETAEFGKININNTDNFYLSMNWEEIGFVEYDNAKKKLLKKVKEELI